MECGCGVAMLCCSCTLNRPARTESNINAQNAQRTTVTVTSHTQSRTYSHKINYVIIKFYLLSRCAQTRRAFVVYTHSTAEFRGTSGFVANVHRWRLDDLQALTIHNHHQRQDPRLRNADGRFSLSAHRANVVLRSVKA